MSFKRSCVLFLLCALLGWGGLFALDKEQGPSACKAPDCEKTLPKIPGPAYNLFSQPIFVLSPDGGTLASVVQQGDRLKIAVTDPIEMRLIEEWEMENFFLHTVEFSTKDPKKLLLAGKEGFFVFDLRYGKRRLAHQQASPKDGFVDQAVFNPETGSVIWTASGKIFESSLHSKTPKVIGTLDPKKGAVNSMTNLNKNRLAVTQKDNPEIMLFSKVKPKEPTLLKGHEKPLVGAGSPNDETLLSLDAGKQILVWDLKKNEIKDKLQLNEKKDAPKILGASLDQNSRSLLVLFEQGQKKIGQKYNLVDLIEGKAKPVEHQAVGTTSGRVYETADLKNPWHQEILPMLAAPSKNPPDPPLVQPSVSLPMNLEKSLLAQAADRLERNETNKALEFLQQIAPNDPDYEEAEVLRKKVYRRIELNNELATAKEQFLNGQFETAKILFASVLAEDPANQTAKNYLELVDTKLNSALWNRLLVLLLVLSLVLGSAFGLYRSRKRLTASLGLGKNAGEDSWGGFFQNRVKQTELREKAKVQRRCYIRIQKLKESFLAFKKTEKVHDFLNEYAELLGKFKAIEARFVRSKEGFEGIETELEKIEAELMRLKNSQKTKTGPKPNQNKQKQEEQKAKTESNGTHQKTNHNQQRSKQEEQKREQKQEQKSQNGQTAPFKPDYFEILGVSRSAGEEEIKKAYRAKIKEYHPDKHNASEYDWIKQEASKRTKILQEAYETLIDSQKRRTYLNNMK